MEIARSIFYRLNMMDNRSCIEVNDNIILNIDKLFIEETRKRNW